MQRHNQPPIEEDAGHLLRLTSLDANDPHSIGMLVNLIEIAKTINAKDLDMKKRIGKKKQPDEKQVSAILLKKRLDDLAAIGKHQVEITPDDLHNSAMQLARAEAESRAHQQTGITVEELTKQICTAMESSISKKELIRDRAISNKLVERFNTMMHDQEPAPGTTENTAGRSLLDLAGNSLLTSVKKIVDSGKKNKSKVIKAIIAATPVREAIESDPRFQDKVLTAAGIVGDVTTVNPRIAAGLVELSDNETQYANVLTRPLVQVLSEKESFSTLFNLLKENVDFLELKFDEKSTTKQAAISLKNTIYKIRSLEFDLSSSGNLATGAQTDLIPQLKKTVLSGSNQNASFMDIYLTAISEAVSKQSPRGKDQQRLTATHATLFPTTGLAREEFKNTKSGVLKSIMVATAPLSELVEKVLRSQDSQDNQIARARIVAGLSKPQTEAENLMRSTQAKL